jgi:hypothetical protein
MRHIIFRAAIASSLALAATAGAQTADGSVEIKAGSQPREVLVGVKNGAGICGMEVRFGDGRVERRRLEAGENWSLNHSYSADGNFTIQAEGVLVVRGLRTAGPCNYGQQAALAMAGASPVLQQPAGAQTQAVAPVAAPGAAQAAAPASTTAIAQPVAPPTQQSTALQPQMPARSAQGPQQDMILMVLKNSSRLRVVNTLDGGKRLSNPEDLARAGDLTTCIIKLPNAYGAYPDATIDAAARNQLRRHLSSMINGREALLRPIDCGRTAGPNIVMRSNEVVDMVLVQRQALASLVSAMPVFTRDYEQLHEFAHPDLFAMADQMREAGIQRRQTLANRAQELDSLAQSDSTEKIGSLTFGPVRPGAPILFCSLSYAGEQGAAIIGYALRGLSTQSDELRTMAERLRLTVNTNRPLDKTYPNLEALFTARQTRPEECMIYVDYPSNLKKLMSALQRDPKAQFQLNQLIEASALRDDWAKRAGYQDYAQYVLSREMKANAQQLKSLGQYQITDKVGLDAAVREMQDSRYSSRSEVADVLTYLKDKADAAGRPGATALSVRDARQKAAQEAAEAQAANARRQRQEVAAEFPFTAVLTCGMPQHMNILGCFAGRPGGGVETELKLRNGDKMTLYKVYNLREAGQERSDGFYIDLRSSYSLQAQNSDDTLILGLKIIERATGRVIHNDQAARFGVVSARN